MTCHANSLLVTGSLHCVACSDQGEVFTWGDNDEGQLGDGTTSAIPIPRLVVALQVTGVFLMKTSYEIEMPCLCDFLLCLIFKKKMRHWKMPNVYITKIQVF
jgi:hypothetical protein